MTSEFDLAQAQRKAYLASAPAVGAREASKTGYANESAAQALVTAQQAFPDLVGAAGLKSIRVPVGGRVVRELRDDQAVIEDQAGHRSVVVGTLPLFGKDPSGASAPVDLGLEAHGGSFVPHSALVPVSIPDTSTGAVSFSDDSVGVHFDSGSPVAATMAGGSVFYANVGGGAADMDAAVRAIPLGAEISFVLRSDSSPESATLAFDLPSGWTLKASADGSVEILTGSGSVAQTVEPAVAADAQGQPVPVSYQVSDPTHLIVNFPHRSGDFAYPIVVDPPVVNEYQGSQARNDWMFSDGSLALHPGPDNEPPEVYGDQSYNYGSGASAEWYYGGPYGSYVYAFDQQSIYHQANSSCEFGGISQPELGPWESGVWAESDGGNGNTVAERCIPYNEWPQVEATYCVNSDCGPTPAVSPGDEAQMGLWVAGSTSNAYAPFEWSDYQAVYLSDTVPLAMGTPTHAGYTPDTWVNYASDTATATATVPTALGLGIYSIGLGGAATPQTQDMNCSNDATGNPPPPPCPMTQSASFQYDTSAFPEGVDTVAAIAEGAGGQTSASQTWHVDVDRTPPAVSANITDPSGNGLDSNGDVKEGSYTVSASATDSSSTHATSGVTAMTIAVDGNPVSHPTQACSNGGCSMSTTWTLNPESYGEGAHKITVTATDQAGNTSPPATITVNVHHSASQPIGPGTVNLSTGELTLNPTDVSIPTFGEALAVSRTYLSRHPSAGGSSGIFGPQWESSLPVGQAEGDWHSITQNPDNTVTLTDAYGDTAAFPAPANPPSGTSQALAPSPAGYADITLAVVSGTPPCTSQTGVYYQLTDAADDITYFMQPPGGSGAFVPVCEQQPSSPSQNVSFAFDNAGRPTTEIGPAPAGVSCTAANATTTDGCRSLTFAYATESSFTSQNDCPNTWGDYPGRLTAVAFHAWDPSVSSMSSVAVARYCYDSTGVLRAEFDPRISPALVTTYGYDQPEQHVVTLTPPGLATWTFTYGALPGDSNAGRLISVGRPDPVNGTATWTMAYNVAISGSGAPYAMDSSTLSNSGQSDDPVAATAIFPPDEVPASPPSDYKRATIYYLDTWGRAVNTADPGGRISTTEYDANDNITRTLTAANRAEALNASNPAAEAKLLDTEYTYGASPLGSGNQPTVIDVVEKLGPQHAVQLANGSQVQARQDTTYTYGDTSTTAGHLPTQVSEGAQVAGQTGDQDVRTTTTAYDDKVGKPTQVTTDSGGLKLVHTTAYDDSTGNATKTIQPANPNGADAHETDTIYYSAATNSTYPACGGHPEWANLACQTQPAAQPGTAGLPDIPVTTYTYNLWGEPTTSTDTASGQTRTTTKSYDSAGRLTSTAVTASAGDAILAVSYTYDPGTGLQTEQSTSDGRNIKTGYDSLGRTTSYQDADNNTSTYNYDIDGRFSTLSDGKGSQTYTYDTTTGDLTALQDSAAGPFSATYNPDGAMASETYPNGMTATTTYDETGAPTGLSYVQSPANCSSNCTWFTDQVRSSIHDQWLHEQDTLGTRDYTYDGAGRLTQTQDTPTGKSCTTRQYAYDADSNRTSLTTVAANYDGSCSTTGGTAATHGYDAADRLTDSGVSYDAWGNTLTLPASDAGGSTLISTYYADNRLHTQTQNGPTVTYSLDPAERIREEITTGPSSSDVIDHFSDSSDSPAWSANGSSWSRNVEGIGGELAAIQNSNGTTTIQITNLHGDVIGTVNNSTSATPTLSQNSDEFGVPYPGPTPQRYNYLGAKRRETALPTGVINMGQREYVPELGRFEQTDPVPGGSANNYDYVNQDPVTGEDLEGTVGAATCLVNLSHWSIPEVRGVRRLTYWAGIGCNHTLHISAFSALFDQHDHDVIADHSYPERTGRSLKTGVPNTPVPTDRQYFVAGSFDIFWGGSTRFGLKVVPTDREDWASIYFGGILHSSRYGWGAKVYVKSRAFSP